LFGAISVLAALHDRGRTGRGASASLSTFDTMVELMSYTLNYTRYTGGNQVPVGMGSPAVAPYGAYPTADDQIVVLGTTNDAEWLRLAAMIERPDLAADRRYLRNPDRVRARDTLDSVIGAWCARRSLAEIQAAADRAGIGNARYNTPLEVLEHPQLAARDRWSTVPSPVGDIVAVLPPPVVAGQPPSMGAIPGLGEHTDAVLAELGFSKDSIASLRARRTI
jgi:itaconate CoA-transferase